MVYTSIIMVLNKAKNMYRLQKEAKKVKKELKNIHIEAEHKGVTVVVDAEQKVVSVTISPDVPREHIGEYVKEAPGQTGIQTGGTCWCELTLLTTLSLLHRAAPDKISYVRVSGCVLHCLSHCTSRSCRILPMKKNFPFIIISVGKMFVALLSMKTSAAVPMRKSSA